MKLKLVFTILFSQRFRQCDFTLPLVHIRQCDFTLPLVHKSKSNAGPNTLLSHDGRVMVVFVVPRAVVVVVVVVSLDQTGLQDRR
jgi:hypothetical protein